MSDLISVVMPAYKAQGTIVRAVQSVMAQTHDDWELVIASDDLFDYEAFLKENGITDARIKQVSTGRNGSGPSGARNVAINNATSRYIALLDADDEFMPEKLALCLEPVKEYGLVSCAIEIRDDAGFMRMIGEASEDRLLKAEDYIFVNISSHSTVVYDYSKIPVLGDSHFDIIEDHVFMLERFTYVDSIYHIGRPLHKYYKVANSYSTSDGLADRFVNAKQELMQRLQDGYYDFANSKIQQAYITFYTHSIAAEKAFDAARQENPDVIFEDVYEQILKDAGVN